MDVISSTPDGVPMLHATPEPVSATQSAVEGTPLPESVPPGADQQPSLFSAAELLAAAPEPRLPSASADEEIRPAPRINKPERFQGEYRTESLDQRLDADHPARLVWSFVESIDLSELFNQIKAVEGGVGRNASDFRVLFALVLWATIDGVASAHEIERLTYSHRAYEWLRGGVPLNYHMISTFKTQHAELLDRVLTESLACLLNEGLVQLNTTAQDGMKVRASAGSDSFRREPKIQEHLEKAQQRVRELRAQSEDPNVGQRQKKARERGAREKVERLQAALENNKKLAADREARKKGDGPKTRTSSTDPDARKMQMPDGGFRPAYNVQFTTDADSKIIVGVDVINQGNDAGQMQPMIKQVQERLDQVPNNHVADGGFSTKKDIEETTKMGTTVYVPVKEEEQQKAKGIDPFKPKKGDKPEVAAWRQRMGTAEAKQIYKLRGETAEWVNAGMRNRGMQQFQVRGLAKVRAVLLWSVLAHNLLRAESLRAAKRASGEIPRA
jgi:transposase